MTKGASSFAQTTLARVLNSNGQMLIVTFYLDPLMRIVPVSATLYFTALWDQVGFAAAACAGCYSLVTFWLVCKEPWR
jgi:hypothetical protein